jgi:PAS domain S-box-containing protein
VQEAAYSFTAEEERAPAHLRIGRLLLAQVAPDDREEAIFGIVGHFNRATALLTSLDEREAVAALNLIAGKRAKKAAAFASALSYLVAGVELVTGAGSRQRDLVFELELHRSECEFLTGDVTTAEERLRMLACRATSVVERAPVTCLLQDVYIALQQPDRGLLECAECLRRAGFDVPVRATEAQAQDAYARILSKVDGLGVDQLAALPLMTDPASGAILDVLAKATSIASIVDKNFEVLSACAAVDLTLERGAHDGSCHAFEQLGYLAGWRFGDFEAAFRLGQLGYELLERQGLRRFAGHVYLMYATLVLPWAKHVVSCRPVIARTFEVSSSTGDQFWAVASRNLLLSNLLLAGDPLVDVEREAEASWTFCRKAPFTDYTNDVGTQAALVRNLRGLTRQFGSLDDERFDELRMENHFASQPHLLCAECWYWIRKLQARFLAGDYAVALDASRRAQGLLLESPGMLERAEHELYSALTHAALCDSVTSDEGRKHLEAMVAHHQQLEVWARHCPENFENRAVLVAAEIARLEDRDADATRLYERASASAHDGGFVNNEALALEMAASFYAGRGFDRIARAYLRDARLAYLKWGADGKVRQLEERYPSLRDENPHPDQKRTLRSPVEHLDLSTVLKLSQAVSGQTDLPTLIAAIMRLSLEHAGAERGLLILPRGDAHHIEAAAKISDDGVTVDLLQTSVGAEDFPESMLQYVVRTGESVLLQDAAVANPFADDDYLRRHRVRSVLCMPLFKQTRLVGIIYLENNLTPGVFTPARMAVLELLGSDAAISLENAHLYRDLQEREARVRRLVDSNIVGIFIWHNDGRVLDTNDAFLRIVGYDREELVSGQVRWPSFTSPELQERLAQGAEATREVGAAQAREWEYIKKDGTPVPVLVGGATFDGTSDEGVAFVSDLTEIKHAEQAVRDGDRRYHELQLRLADAHRVASIGELSASIAHEINQPLSGIITNAGTCLRLLAAQPPNIDGASETARRTIRDGNRATEVITRLRALFAKKENAAEPVDLSDATREVLAMTSNELQRAGVMVKSDLADGPCVVTGDRVQLQQVIMNLLRNALDAMRSIHDRPRQLVISTQVEDGGRVRLTVRDSGPGLGSLDPERLFEAFYTTKKAGMGIGLFVSRSIIERHGGRLWAEPDPGPGATFSFSIPI